MEGKVAIYALCDDRGIRYIGQTRYVDERRKQHAKVWPEWTMQVLREVDAHEADDVERRLIAEHETAGCELANWVHTERARRRSRQVAVERIGRQPTVCARVHHVTLRLPRTLHARLRAIAERERRSLHAQVIQLLDEAMAEREQQHKP